MTQRNLMLIASGTGTDADAIMRAHYTGQIPKVGHIVLVSTKPGADCLEKAAAFRYPGKVVVPRSRPFRTQQDRCSFLEGLSQVASDHHCDFVFLVGCNVIVPFEPPQMFFVCGLPMYNIHPADPDHHGGIGMHGWLVHAHVLAEAVDLVRRGKKSMERDRFFTYPTVHEVTEKPDDGPTLLRATVEIPKDILWGILKEETTMKDAALALQQVVLPYEWLMLPTAVKMAAIRLV